MAVKRVQRRLAAILVAEVRGSMCQPVTLLKSFRERPPNRTQFEFR